nr:hypothetical protein GCM10020093_002780 [Planobispora longispora]
MALDLAARAAPVAEVVDGVENGVQHRVVRLDQAGRADQAEDRVVRAVETGTVRGREPLGSASFKYLFMRTRDHGIADIYPSVPVHVVDLDGFHQIYAPSVIVKNSGIDPTARVVNFHTSGRGEGAVGTTRGAGPHSRRDTRSMATEISRGLSNGA